jgi:anti-sigma regulatory factor (Ser/Thr protein kinase)
MCAPGVLWSYRTQNAKVALAERERLLEVVRQHSGWMVDEEAAHVVFTELVGNVIRHAPGPIDITLECDGKSLLLNVGDQGPGFAFNAKLPENIFMEGGRGLFIVSRFATQVQVQKNNVVGAKVVAKLPNKPSLAEVSIR